MKVCRTRVSSMMAGLVGLMILVLRAAPGIAGVYEVSYSGGACTTVNDGNTSRQAYITDAEGYYRGVSPASWGTKTLSDGSMVATSGSADCSGEITTTFSWYRDYPEDLPPKAVVIAEASSASWFGSNCTNVPTGSSSNGLGFPQVPSESSYPGSNCVRKTGISRGTRYKIEQNPGASFSITCSPQAEVAATGTVGPPPGGGNGDATVSYKASAQPLQVSLGGGLPLVQDNVRVLIGQQVFAGVETGGLQANSYFWSVGGGRAFKGYAASDSNGLLTKLFMETDSGYTFHFAEPDDTVAVNCTVELQVPPGAMFVGSSTVDLSRECIAEAPPFSLTAGVGSVEGFPASNPTGVRLWGAPFGSDQSSGSLWGGRVDPMPDYGEGGTWNFTQLVWVGRYRTMSGTQQYLSINGQKALDTRFPYGSHNPANGVEHYEGDSPQEPVNYESVTSVTVNEPFTTFMLYLPPGEGSVFVPLKHLYWKWGFTSSPNSGGIWEINDPVATSVMLGNYPPHPEWDLRAVATQFQWVP